MKEIRQKLTLVVLIMICIGVIMIYSASAIYANKFLGDSAYFLKRHLVYLTFGIFAAAFVMAFDYKLLQKYSKPLVIISLTLLVLLLLPGIGKEVAGAKRWIRISGFSFQPSEFAQLCLILYAADYLARTKKLTQGGHISVFIPLGIASGCVILLTLLQPDLGTSFATGAIVFIMVYYAGISLKYIFAAVLLISPALYWLIFSVPYRRIRVIAFLNPWMDPKGSGFQLIQSQIALGSGGIFGVGLGRSRQKLFYLPAAHTDFIYSIIGEEFGLLGSLLVLSLFIIFIGLVAKIINNCQDYFGKLLALGLLSMISLKAIINMAVSCGIMPTKGLPLPFISYGGTSLVIDLISVGLILNISLHSQIK